MRITKLHLLIFFFVVAISSFGFYFWKIKQTEKIEREIKMQEQRKAEEEALKKITESEAAPLPPQPASEKKESVEATYTVQEGDTLWSISKKAEHFGIGHRWYDIWKANEESIFDFDIIVPGQVINIPLDKPEDHTWPITPEDKKRKILREENVSEEESQPTN